jgi:hypothetical protein
MHTEEAGFEEEWNSAQQRLVRVGKKYWDNNVKG